MNPKTYRSSTHVSSPVATGRYVSLDGEEYYRIANSHIMAPFFVSLVSSSDHWLFVASNGAITMGRRNSNNAFFPYYSSDKLLDMVSASGPRTVIRVADVTGGHVCWEPFRDAFPTKTITRSLYKNVPGSRICFEEIHADLGLIFRYCWQTSEQFGFVRSCYLINLNDEPKQIALLDGFQNILPYGTDEWFQLRFSNLVDAYKKCELMPEVGLGVYYLSSIPTDHAQPNEGLRASVAWQIGFNNPLILLSTRQIPNFQRGGELSVESDLKGQRGSYLIHSAFELPSNETRSWKMVADVAYDQTDIAKLLHKIKRPEVQRMVSDDVREGEQRLHQIIVQSDGVQLGENQLRTHRHRSNVTFNLMRGGTPRNGYQVDLVDFLSHVKNCSQVVFRRHTEFWQQLTEATVSRQHLLGKIDQTGDLDLMRIGCEYLPLTFGRRHGDPTRPWNTFSIELKNIDGSPRIHYEGNWRDIFQNWEALACSYPHFLLGMILRFVNASTADGYNPYRINREGFDWEQPEPADPWANIGYWGDHQVAYLQKLLEWSFRFAPADLSSRLALPIGVYANIPYRIRPYSEILKDPYQTIDYDYQVARQIEQQVRVIGVDGRLLVNRKEELHRVSLIEKILLPALIKITNLVPEAGIWLNTQRPEWNDANNALVGKGASVVTVCYLRRYFQFLLELLRTRADDHFSFSCEVANLLKETANLLQDRMAILSRGFTAHQRRAFVDQLQNLGCQYRQQIYRNPLGQYESLSCAELSKFAEDCLQHLDHTIDSNERADGLYHSYNLLKFEHSASSNGKVTENIQLPGGGISAPATANGGSLKFDTMYEMLEGQVAAISSRRLSPERILEVLTALRNSALYRSDLETYLLYPDRELPGFMEKNKIQHQSAVNEPLIEALLNARNQQVVRRDANGDFRFNGDLRNADDLANQLREIAQQQPHLAKLIGQRSENLRQLYCHTFQHHQFTGRSGTFFAYEGLGSVYWHMVSKLLLAIADTIAEANSASVSPEILGELREHYREIREGLGIMSLPSQYGAFPIDPYSHTPKHAGAQQPGMTGQVKEDILSRMVELGIRIRQGTLIFHPELFETNELLTTPGKLEFYNVQGQSEVIDVPQGHFAFSFCQVPIIYGLADQARLRIHLYGNLEPVEREGNSLSLSESKSVFERAGKIKRIEFFFPQQHLT